MRSCRRGWVAGLIGMLAASSAGAQLVPEPKLNPTLSSPQKAVRIVPKAVTVPPKLTAAPSAIIGKSGPAGAIASSPLLKAPLGSAGQLKAPLGSVVQLKAPLGRTTDELISTVSTRLPPSVPVVGTASPALGTDRRGLDFALNNVWTRAVPSTSAGLAQLLAAHNQRVTALIRDHAAQLESDGQGHPVVRGRLLVLDPDVSSLAAVQRAGFRIITDVRDPALTLRVVTLAVPAGLSARAAFARLRSAAPRLSADYDHLYQPAGGPLGPTRSSLSRDGGGSKVLIGMVDGGVASHPALAGHIAEQRGFSGPPRATGHGTAVASLLAGQQGRFRGSANGASLLVADVYGGHEAGGSATSIEKALSWLAQKHPRVINVSLVGPPNELMRRTIAAVRSRGIQVVAAVGNDGPAAPPQFPASYPGVLSITGVDARGIALFESGNATHLDFAAPGADMAAARPGRGYVRVRGTSFAAPLAAGRLALVGSVQRLIAEARPGKGRIGHGIVCATCRTDPTAVGAR
jgi:hypothetical protein